MGTGLNGLQQAHFGLYVSGTIGQFVAQATSASAVASTITNASTMATAAVGTSTGGTGTGSGAGGTGGNGSGNLNGRLLDSNIQYENAPTSNNQRNRHTASNHQGDRGGNVGATIRTIEINGQRFNLRGGNGATPPNNGNTTTSPAQ